VKFLDRRIAVERNIKEYSNQKIEDYEKRNIFHIENQKRIEKNIKEIKERTKGRNALDIGIGSGNVYFYLAKYFDNAYGLDVALELAKQKGIPINSLIKADCQNLPFKNNSFDLITAYELIHHLKDPEIFFKQAFSCLKNNGMLYIDGEKNRKFFKYYVKISLIISYFYRSRDAKYWKDFFKPHSDGEYHFGGFFIEDLYRELKRIGFREISINYRLTTNPKLKKKLTYKILKFIKIKSLYTHLVIIAKK
jgi:ubiquinone/menaquinone biosynthesis C-methylase UbiE